MKAKSPAPSPARTIRKRVYDFMGLPTHVKLERLRDLGIYEDGDCDLPGDECDLIWINRAKEKNLHNELIDGELRHSEAAPPATPTPEYNRAYEFMHKWLLAANPRYANHKITPRIRRTRLAQLLADYAADRGSAPSAEGGKDGRSNNCVADPADVAPSVHSSGSSMSAETMRAEFAEFERKPHPKIIYFFDYFEAGWLACDRARRGK
jgi:hypothetical protein